MSGIKSILLVSILLLISLPNTFAFLGVSCVSMDDYKFGQMTSVSVPSSAYTNSWVTITIQVKNNGECNTLYRAYAEVPTDIFTQYSFPDYFWLDSGESKTVSMKLYTGGITGTGTLNIKLESHYTALTSLVDSETRSITISEESPTVEEQIQQTQDAIQEEVTEEITKAQEEIGEIQEAVVEEIDKTQQLIDTALSSATFGFQKSVISKLGNIHFALHIVGENAANEDMIAAREAQRSEIRIVENAADAIAIAVGHAFTPVAGAGQAVAQSVCAFSNFKNTPIGDIRNAITQRLLKNDIVSDRYVGEQQNTYTSVYLGGPLANKKMGLVNSQMKELNLPYFEGNNLVAPDGKTYSWGYGVYAIIPDISPGSIQADGTFSLNIQELNNRMARGESRLYYIVASGTDRDGTSAAQKAYLETLAVAEEMSKVLRKGLCMGDLGEDDLYLLGAVLNSHARAHAITALKHPEVLDFGIEFTQSLMLLGNSEYKTVKLRPMALVVKATGDTWTPVGVYYGR